MNEVDLEERLRRLEAIEAINCLMFEYARACDTGFDGERIASLFVEDGVWMNNGGEILVGRQRIKDFFNLQSKHCKFALHFYTNAMIDVFGEHAIARFLLLQACTVVNEDKAQGEWMTGDYLNEYVQLSGIWRIQTVRLNQRFRVANNRDWGELPLSTTTLAGPQ